jgi:hypothetical protein
MNKRRVLYRETPRLSGVSLEKMSVNSRFLADIQDRQKFGLFVKR